MGGVKLTALEALWGGLTATLTPGMLMVLPVFLAFLMGSLRYELAGAPIGRQRRDVLVTAFFFAVGFNTIFVIFSLAAVIGQQMGSDALAVRAMTGGMVGLWGLRQVMGLRVRIGDDISRSRLGLDDWPVAALVGLVIGAALSLGWQAVSGPVLGTILGLQMNEGAQHGAGFLMALYAMGLTLGMVGVGAGVLPLLLWIARERIWLRRLEMGCGILLLLAAGAIVSGNALTFADWLVAHLPGLNRLG
ncbi:MAG: hypothetical protein GC134_00260 [Proteobacteria bacterium]|nr:hypothetical protein [Pseudomonadota bacterium]